MKTLTPFIFSLALSFSLTHAADAPKAPGTGPGREKMKEMLLQKFDTNKNGTLDPDEKAAAMKAMQERRGGSPKGGASGAPGGKMREMVLQRFDANKNGTLDPDEKAAAMKAMQERRSQSPGSPGSAPSSSESGSKFRRPPEAK